MTSTSQSWKDVKIQDITVNLDNKRVPVTKSDRKVGDIPYYGATGIVDYVDDYIFDEKLLLIGEDGADWSPYANSAFIIDGKSWVNNHAHVLRVTGADIEFLREYLNFSDLRLHVSGTTRGKLNKSDLMNIQIPIPSIQAQQKISNILMTVNKEIAKTDQIIQKTEILKKGLLFDQFLKGKDSKEWKYLKLNKITHKITDGTHRTPKYLENGIPFLRINDIHNSEIDWNNTKHISPEEHGELIKRCYPEKGDILLSKNGTIGITKVVNWDKPFSIFVSLCLIKPNIDIVMSDYLGLVVGSDFVLDQAKQRSKQGTVTNLHLEEIRDFDIPVPSKDIQQKIIDIASVVDVKLKNERERYSNLVNLKQGLMHDIFSKKVEVN